VRPLAPRSPLPLRAAVALTLALGALGAPPGAHAAPAEMRLAVLEFVSASSDEGLEALGKGLQSMVTTDLSGVATLRLIERARINEIIAEQELAGAGLVDAATAAKVGRLAGASHLLGGTFTVHGATMRIDARVFTVEGGEVLLAEAITGDREAFFELQKALVQKLIRALGLSLAPRERASVAQIHTADFDAFRRFSEGVAAFDAERYDAALEAMRAAASIDGSFDLARVTLDEYEGLVARIRGRADSLALTGRELAQARDDEVAARDAQIAQRLMAIASDRSDSARERRMAALIYLVGLYGPGSTHGRITRFQQRQDGLLVRRRAAALGRAYLAESRAVFPRAPLFAMARHPPERLEELDDAIAGVVRALPRALSHREDLRDGRLIENLRGADSFADLIDADHGERIRLLEDAAEKLAALRAEPTYRSSLLETLANRYLEIGDVDAAAGALARASAVQTVPIVLERLAKRVEELGALSAMLAATDKEDALRELIAGTRGRLAASQIAAFEAPGPVDAEVLHALVGVRVLSRHGARSTSRWRIGSEPAELIEGNDVLFTGRREAHLRSDTLRYYRPAQSRSRDALVAIGGGTQDRVDLRFTLRYRAAPDFWPRQTSPRRVPSRADLALDPGTPEVTVLFGLRDVITRQAQDPKTRARTYPNPTQAYGVRITRAAVELVRVGEDAPAERLRLPEMTVRALATHTPGARGDEVTVRVAVEGRAVRVEVGGARASFELPDDEAAVGFLGLHFRGDGYVELADIAL